MKKHMLPLGFRYVESENGAFIKAFQVILGDPSEALKHCKLQIDLY